MIRARWLITELLRGWLLAAMLLVALISLLVLLEELEDLGDGRYGIVEVLWVVAAGIPSRLVAMMPFVALLGTLFAYADLARRSEIVALAAAGSSRLYLAGLAAVTALGVSAIAMPIDEWFAAPLYREALIERLALTGKSADVLGAAGFWSHSDHRFVNLGTVSSGGDVRGVRVFQFDAAHRLQRIVWAEQLLPGAGGFELTGVRERRYGVTVRQHDRPRMPAKGIEEKVLLDAALPPAALSLRELARHIGAIKRLGHAGQREAGVFWQRALKPFATLALALLAVPFVFGSLRGGGFALRLAAGVALGLGYYIASQIIFNAGLLTGWPPVAVAIAPIALVTAVVLPVLARR